MPDSASTWWAESTVPSASFGSSSREQALEPEQQRPLAAPLRRRDLRAGLDLGQRGVERAAARGAGRERGRGVLALGQEGLTGERRRAVDLFG